MLNDFSIFKDSEALLDTRLSQKGLAVVRLDGAKFSSLTKQFEKPFSDVFENAMNDTATAVFKRVLPGALVVYVASDEISLIVSDSVAALPYGRRVQKITSLSASFAALAFDRAVPNIKGFPAFDSRVLSLDEDSYVREYITWRRLDCRKNATSMAAESLMSHKALMGVSTRDRGEALVGTRFEKISEGTFNGRFIRRAKGHFTVDPATRELTEELCAAAVERHNEASQN